MKTSQSKQPHNLVASTLENSESKIRSHSPSPEKLNEDLKVLGDFAHIRNIAQKERI